MNSTVILSKFFTSNCLRATRLSAVFSSYLNMLPNSTNVFLWITAWISMAPEKIYTAELATVISRGRICLMNCLYVLSSFSTRVPFRSTVSYSNKAQRLAACGRVRKQPIIALYFDLRLNMSFITSDPGLICLF